MDKIRKTFLAVLKSALLGEQADLGGDLLPEQWQELFAMAQIHHVLPLVLFGFPHCRESGSFA